MENVPDIPAKECYIALYNVKAMNSKRKQTKSEELCPLKKSSLSKKLSFYIC